MTAPTPDTPEWTWTAEAREAVYRVFADWSGEDPAHTDYEADAVLAALAPYVAAREAAAREEGCAEGWAEGQEFLRAARAAADAWESAAERYEAERDTARAEVAAAEQRGAEKERERIATAIDAARPSIPPSTDPKRERNLAARLAYNHASRLARTAAVAVPDTTIEGDPS